MTSSLGPSPQARRARWAVSAIFLLNGITFCSVLPRYPEIVRRLDISNVEFGAAVAVGPVGGLIAGLGAVWVMRRFGSGLTAVIFQIMACVFHLLIYTSSSWAMLALGFFLAFSADAITDIAQNAHGMRVERRYRRSIMNSYHGFWSLGAVLGGIIGALCAQWHVPMLTQGVATLVVFGAAAIVTSRFLLPGSDSAERAAQQAETAMAGPSPASANTAPTPTEPASIPRAGLRAWGLLVALGMLLVFAGSTEDAGNTWGALFMTSTFNAIPFVAGLAFVALQGTQMVARFLGDRIVDAWGDRTTARVGALISAVGMGIAMLVPSPVTAILGFAAAGWGVATLFPAAFRAGDDLPGLPEGVGITFVGWFSRIGFFVAPPVVGALADAFTLRYALWLMPLYAVGIFLFSGALGTETKADRARATETR